MTPYECYMAKVAAESHQAHIEDLLNRFHAEADDHGYEFFAVAGHPDTNEGASTFAARTPNSPARNARQAHMRWEVENGVDPHHDRRST